MNRLTESEWERLYSLAERYLNAVEKRNHFAQQSNIIYSQSGKTKSVRNLEQKVNQYDYLMFKLVRQIERIYPYYEQIIRRFIARRATPNILSGRYQTTGRLRTPSSLRRYF